MSAANENGRDALAQLAAHCGISAGYDDVWGKTHATSEKTLRALLAAMHFPADGDPAALLQGLQDDEWRRPLPPVKVITLGETPTLAVSLPVARASQPHRWILSAENGATSSGEFEPAKLPRLAEQRLDGVDFLRGELLLPPPSEAGYYRLEVEQPGSGGLAQVATTLVVAPPSCFLPDAVQRDGRVWGPTVQLYGLRSRRNWGIGDFGDLRTLIDLSADAGGGVIGVNPLHALFPDDPTRISPYSPSSRCFVNVLYIDVEAVPEFAECEAARNLVASERFQGRLRRLRVADEVDYEEVSAAKREVLAALYRHFRDQHLANDSARARAFRLFRAESGQTLELHARFEALQAHFQSDNPDVWGWPAWPEEYRDPQAPAVAAFADEHSEAVEYSAWLQWLADEQLTALGQQSLRRGVGVGLYQDLAVGVNPGGSEAWAWQGAFAGAAYVGAPPDEFNPVGQNWGLPPLVPHRLREAAYAPFIAMLRANMRHCGALRIDHVMGLARLFWVPVDQPATEGAYVSYALEDLLAIVALESQRNRCMVIGEDLGTVPDGFRPRLAAAGVLSYRPFLFERSADGNFKPPAEYPRQALVAVSTHDLPTLQGFWKGHDIDTRAALQLFPEEAQFDHMVVDRAQDRARFLMALKHAELLPEGASVHPFSIPEITQPLVVAIHAFLARTPAQLLVVQPEDILGVVEQANLPGSRDDQHPNWRRRLPLHLEDWPEDGRFNAVGEVLINERGTAVVPPSEMLAPTRVAVIPRATYRMQFNRDFTFAQAGALASYLAALGVSHCYASPYLRARPGSTHGYDIVGHSELNPEIGTPQEFEDFATALKENGLSQVIDVVPNHMGIMGSDNAWWLDVLENGPASAWGAFFDIDWDPLNRDLKGKVLLPLLGAHYGQVLNAGELRLDYDAERGEFSIFYYQHRLPVDPASYPRIIGHRRERLAAALGEGHERYGELETLLTAFGHLPARSNSKPVKMAERQRDKEVHKRHLAAFTAEHADIAHHIADNLAEFNGRPGHPASFDLLHELIQVQGYRLAYWRVACDEINYRRFFDINDLAALRMEDPAVFDATHHLILDLVAQGKVEGLRIDHPDGMFDPGEYFRHLQQAAGGRLPAPGGPLSIYLVIEKILAEHERLPDDWPIHGATGYRFANLVNNLFVDTASERRMTRIYRDFTGVDSDFEELAYDAKKLIMYTALASEFSVLANRLARIANASRDTCDFTLNGLREALIEVVACFPVYRSYVAHGELSADDRRHIAWAVAVAKKRSPLLDTGIYDFIEGVLTTDLARGCSASYREPLEAFAMKFQQVSSPVMAKGVEDTAFYRYHRLTSLNDVGGEPRRFGVSVAAFHAATRARAVRWPHNMLATSTHDSKRSEDARARINVLSEIPAAWKLMLKRWRRLNRGRKRLVDGGEAPSRNDEYLLYQTLIGTWPLLSPNDDELADYRTRIAAYMTKALREGKEHSSWVQVNDDYEAAVSDFVHALLAPGEKNLFLADFVPMVHTIAHHGLINALAQALIKVTSPGVPDIYQGCELWQFNLVDPDNRRPVDFVLRGELLAEVQALVDAPPEQWCERLQPLVSDMSDGRIKLYTLWQSLALRARWPKVFEQGDYLPLKVTGEHAAHVCAYARRHGEHAMVVVVPLLSVRLLGDKQLLPLGNEVWADTLLELPDGLASAGWNNVLSGESHSPGAQLAIGDILASFPVALLASPGEP
ncbi:MAG: Maltooligosyl trehalose synthase [Candidatus Accumulibacter regalis]|uniref:4-alpha-glucanotransferase n=1 Tax=Accumulibacter regalis TaxID=522306 RepID=A0A011PMP5_ACCRE|nr:malto-oligosyltrehalose synthase [Accumulibacter sp.]EXI88741.1 MAG: Maltooligosyl trehalose synthase [Candidatus Accumulibacter regalis]HRE72446.1 malto-oligosyltrehalose synthase [Accumulibacter sp.]HRE86734.1 malto-oligosyltrehalose synthase [Accumulibacter sp.]